MAIETLQSFLTWCIILNFGLMIISFLIIVIAGDWAYRIHSMWIPLPRETFNVVLYSVMSVYKLMVFFFVVVPYVAILLTK